MRDETSEGDSGQRTSQGQQRTRDDLKKGICTATDAPRSPNVGANRYPPQLPSQHPSHLDTFFRLCSQKLIVIINGRFNIHGEVERRLVSSCLPIWDLGAVPRGSTRASAHCISLVLLAPCVRLRTSGVIIGLLQLQHVPKDSMEMVWSC